MDTGIKVVGLVSLFLAVVLCGIGFLCFNRIATVGCFLCLGISIISQKIFSEDD